MIRKKPALGLDPRVDFRFSEKIMLQQEIQTSIRFNLIGSRSRSRKLAETAY
jgi:hypothetical protein